MLSEIFTKVFWVLDAIVQRNSEHGFRKLSQIQLITVNECVAVTWKSTNLQKRGHCIYVVPTVIKFEDCFILFYFMLQLGKESSIDLLTTKYSYCLNNGMSARHLNPSRMGTWTNLQQLLTLYIPSLSSPLRSISWMQVRTIFGTAPSFNPLVVA